MVRFPAPVQCGQRNWDLRLQRACQASWSHRDPRQVREAPQHCILARNDRAERIELILQLGVVLIHGAELIAQLRERLRGGGIGVRTPETASKRHDREDHADGGSRASPRLRERMGTHAGKI